MRCGAEWNLELGASPTSPESSMADVISNTGERERAHASYWNQGQKYDKVRGDCHPSVQNPSSPASSQSSQSSPACPNQARIPSSPQPLIPHPLPHRPVVHTCMHAATLAPSRPVPTLLLLRYALPRHARARVRGIINQITIHLPSQGRQAWEIPKRKT